MAWKRKETDVTGLLQPKTHFTSSKFMERFCDPPAPLYDYSDL